MCGKASKHELRNCRTTTFGTEPELQLSLLCMQNSHTVEGKTQFKFKCKSFRRELTKFTRWQMCAQSIQSALPRQRLDKFAKIQDTLSFKEAKVVQQSSKAWNWKQNLNTQKTDLVKNQSTERERVRESIFHSLSNALGSVRIYIFNSICNCPCQQRTKNQEQT